MLPCNQLVEEKDYKYLVGLNTIQNMTVTILQQKRTAKLQLLAVNYRLHRCSPNFISVTLLIFHLVMVIRRRGDFFLPET